MVLSAALLLFILLNQVFDFEVKLQPKFWSEERAGEEQPKPSPAPAAKEKKVDLDRLSVQVTPAEGVKLPIAWGDLGEQMVAAGVIDADKFRRLFNNKLTAEQEAMLAGDWEGAVVITQQNARFILDLLWALGLGNKNRILEEGDMMDRKYGGADRFASTAGWSLAKGDPMNHYSKHAFVSLDAKQQQLVEEVAKGIYRPCCGNSTYFPDCNHGMAMLGLLELMASQGATKAQMYRSALAVNSYWFPQTYLDLATYFKEQGKDWSRVDPQVVLGKDYSSVQGYRAMRKKIKSLPSVQKGSGGCGV
jgi:hypothetical protein